ncbi:hypothetical protein ScPMuIL_000992 [Solemya velum]
MESSCSFHCQENCKYTDVVVIGNGPSGICMSYLLSGHRPYFSGEHHSNPLLHSKLKQIPSKDSVVEQDLEYLCEGLEGRSTNPVALLFDALSHPDADLGSELPSLLTWKKEEQAISHVIFGKYKPGGAWQNMDGSMQTLSQSNWMELPTVTFREWLTTKKRTEGVFQNRATISEVRSYYEDFVKVKELTSNFCNEHVVTSVQKVFQTRNGVDSESGEVLPCCKNVSKNHPFLWEVRGYKLSGKEMSDNQNGNVQREEFCFAAPHVILATGTYDIPNKVGTPGENLPHVLHSLSEFEKVMMNNSLYNKSSPLLIIGSGLSAADAVLMADEYNIPVIHVFRCSPNDSSLIFKKLPQGMYEEYHKVHALMKGKLSHPLYKPYKKHNVVEFKDDQKVLLESIDGNVITSLDISYALVLVGSRPDLSFLPQDGQNLGHLKRFPIDSKHNPIDIDPYTHQCNRELGLFAMGPLVGDNFVRFAIGGSLAIANHLIRKNKKET